MPIDCVFKMKFGNILRRVRYSYTQDWNGDYRWEPELTFETLQSQIRMLFELPSAARFRLTYKDIDHDIVTIGNSDDLTYFLVQQPITNPKSLEVTLLTSRSSSGQASCGIADSDQINFLGNNEAVKQLMTKLTFESARLQIQAYEVLSEGTNSAAQIPSLVENLLQITMASSELASRLTIV